MYRLEFPFADHAGPCLLCRLPNGLTAADLHVTLARTFWHVGDWERLLSHKSICTICFHHTNIASTISDSSGQNAADLVITLLIKSLITY